MKKCQSSCLEFLKARMNQYAAIKEETWSELKQFCTIKEITKNQNLISIGELPQSFYFVCKGLVLAYTQDESDNAKQYNKNFFQEGSFPGPMTSLLKNERSRFTLQALENTVVIAIDHTGYRALLERKEDLKWYHIQYIEKHWMLDKEPQEISFALQNAKQRYLEFVSQHPEIVARVPQHQIAARLGITPTQLSRIRHNLK